MSQIPTRTLIRCLQVFFQSHHKVGFTKIYFLRETNIQPSVIKFGIRVTWKVSETVTKGKVELEVRESQGVKI